ncbi:MAG: 3-hydroxyisobutyryl-CoA hydrolase, partial [Rhodoferax sp.]
METTRMKDVLTEVRGQVGFITLNRFRALNALSLDMVRSLTATLLQWQADPAVQAVAIRGTSKSHATGEGVPFGGFCAGGDIRFFHQAALVGNPELEDFFTEEYSLNHLIHHYTKPYIAFMDGIVMGGGMGISQGASHRLVTARTKMAMPETNIGLFPDVGGGHFLGACPGRAGEWLALTGDVINGATALALGLADVYVDVAALQAAWDALAQIDFHKPDAIAPWLAMHSIAAPADSMPHAS